MRVVGLNSLSVPTMVSALFVAGMWTSGASAADRAPVMEEPPVVEMTPLPDSEPPLDIGPEDTAGVERFQMPSPAQTANHYTCYRVAQGKPPFQPRVVVLKDQFGARKVKVIGITRLCAPTMKYAGQGVFKPSDPRLHLVCYRISESKPANRIALIANQFGRAVLKVADANELCLPSIKRLFR